MPKPKIALYWLLLSILGSSLIAIATGEFGAGVSEDSAKYMSVAQSIAAGDGFLMYNGEPMTQWPPGYPVLLAALHLLTGADVFVLGWILNILLFGLVVFFSGLLFWRAFGERSLFTYVGPVFALTSIGLISAAVTISSDVLFMLVVLVFLLYGESYLRRPTPATFIWMVVWAITGTFARYVGVSLVMVGALVVFLAPGMRHQQRLMRAGLFGLLSGIPLVAWATLHNYQLTHTFFGPRTFASPLLNLSLTVDKVVAWFVPDVILRLIPPLAILLLLLLCLFLTSQKEGRNKFVAVMKSPAVLPSGAFALCYVLVLAITSSYYEFQAVGFDRVHAILLPSLVLLAFVSISVLPSRLKTRLSPLQRRILLASVLMVLILFTGYRMQKYVRMAADGGETLFNFANTHIVRQSDLAHYLAESVELRQGSLFSNNEAVLWFYVRQRIDRVPRVGQPTDWPRGEHGYVVWFLGELDYKPGLVDLDAFVQQGWLQQVFADELGVVYKITAPSP